MKRLILVMLGLLLFATARTSGQGYEVARVAANPAKGFHWPYYLAVPASVKLPAVLLVQPNGTGYPFDDLTPHDAAAFSQSHGTQNPQGLGLLGSPSLVPVFPRPRNLYTQSLDRDTMLTKLAGYERLDLQLIAMVEDARARLTARGIAVDPKFWMRGFSAPGSFTSRFALLHPHLVKAASVGAAGYGPALPVDTWKGRRLDYPYGTADLETVAGEKFDVASFRQIAFQIYIGDLDRVSDAEWQPGQNADQAMLTALFGLPNVPLAYMRYEEIYNSVTALSQVLTIPGFDHREQPAAFDVEFFERNRGTPAAPPPKPMLYSTAVANVICGSGAATALSLFNGIDGVAARGEVQLFQDGSSMPLVTLPVSLSRGGRRQLDVCQEAPGLTGSGWAKIRADSGFLAARARLASPARDFGALVAASGVTAGVLAGVSAAASRLGLVNAGDEPVVVRLFAHDAAGGELAQTIMEIEPKTKVTGTAETIFGKAVPAVSHVRFEARGKISAFVANLAADGTPLEILPAFRHYDR